MNAIPRHGTDAFLALYESRRHRLPGDAAARARAAGIFARHGLPTPRDEAWRYTNLRPLLDAGLPDDAGTGCGQDIDLLPASRDLPSGVAVNRFPEASADQLAAPEGEPLVALNTMLAEDGFSIDVANGIDGGTLTVEALSRPGVAAPRHRIRLAPGARLTLIEVARGSGTYWHLPVFEIDVARGASLAHVRLQDEDAAAAHLATIHVAVDADGIYDGFTLGLGARLARTEIRARVTGAGASVHLNAAQLLDGARTGDVTTVVAHDAPGCASRQTVKSVLADAARGVFQGRIEVARAAQKTDGHQMSQALLLSDRAEMDTKPELRIYADDVKCSHGATVGALDESQVFYLRSRGVPDIAARAILVRAFLAGALEAVADTQARTLLDAAVDAWWDRRA